MQAESQPSDNNPPDIPKRFFKLSTVIGGNLGGISGADASCNADGARPSTSSTYKAFIVGATVRRACITPQCTAASENIDWVLKPLTTYLRSDGVTVIGKTNSAGILAFPLSASLGAGTSYYLTGLAADWTTGSFCTGSGTWTGTMSATNVNGGRENFNTTNAIFDSQVVCTSSTNNLMCVEQ